MVASSVLSYVDVWGGLALGADCGTGVYVDSPPPLP